MAKSFLKYIENSKLGYVLNKAQLLSIAQKWVSTKISMNLESLHEFKERGAATV